MGKLWLLFTWRGAQIDFYRIQKDTIGCGDQSTKVQQTDQGEWKKSSSLQKKGEVPNTIAVIVTCFSTMHRSGMDYRSIIESLELKAKTKKGAGFAKKKEGGQDKHKSHSGDH